MIGYGTGTFDFCERWARVEEALDAYVRFEISYSYCYQVLTTCFGFSGNDADEAMTLAMKEYQDSGTSPINGPRPIPPSEDPISVLCDPYAGKTPQDVKEEYLANRITRGKFQQILQQCFGYSDLESEDLIQEADREKQDREEIDDILDDDQGGIYAPPDNGALPGPDDPLLIGQPSNQILMIVGIIVIGFVAVYVVNTAKEATK